MGVGKEGHGNDGGPMAGRDLTPDGRCHQFCVYLLT